jgi:uridine kinase
MSNISSVIEQIGKIEKDRGSILIAIEWFGGSGKTTFSNKLQKALEDSIVVHIDDFIIKENLNENSWDKGAFDRSRLERQVLIPIKNNLEAKYQKLIWDTNTLSEHITLPQVWYIIVEGISSYHPDIEMYYDYKVWIDTPINIAKERWRNRDGNNNISWDMWAQNDLDYKTRYHPERRADIIVTN